MLLTTRSRRVQQIFRSRNQALAEARDNIRRQITPHKPLHEVLPDGSWAGEPCFLIGGGPSLIGFDFNRLRGHGRVIAINRAFEFIPWADALFFMDWRFYKACHEPPKLAIWEAFQGHKVFLNLMGRKLDDCLSVRSLGRHGMSWSLAKGIYHGNNSGHGALMMALALGCRPAYLLGYDMNVDAKGRSHFHGGYGHKPSSQVARIFIKEFQELRRRTPKVDWIWNLNPKSGCRSFPFKTIDEVLHDRPTGQSVGSDEPPVLEPDARAPSS